MTAEARTLAIAALGGLIGVAAILAVVLGSSEATADRPPSRIVFESEAGLFTFDPETGEPHAAVSFEREDERPVRTLIIGDLVYVVSQEHRGSGGEERRVTAFDGALIGLPPTALPTDATGALRSWTLPDAHPNAASFPHSIAASDDGHTVYAIRFLAPGSPQLWRFDIEREQPVLLTDAIELGQLHLSATGRLFLLPHKPSDAVIELDVNDGRELSRIEADGAWSFSLLAGDGRHLYLFREEDRGLTVVDLDTMRVTDELTLPEQAPPPSQWPWSTALSPDGTRLYLTGNDPVACRGAVVVDRRPTCIPPPLGTQVIDLATLEVLYNDPQANLLALSPDGRRLITSLLSFDPAGDPNDAFHGNGLKLIDTESFEVITHFDTGGAWMLPIISADGHFAYALSFGPGQEAVVLSEPCTEDCATITVFDLERLDPIATHIYNNVDPINFPQ